MVGTSAQDVATPMSARLPRRCCKCRARRPWAGAGLVRYYSRQELAGENQAEPIWDRFSKIQARQFNTMIASGSQVVTAWKGASSDRSLAIIVFLLLAVASLLPVLLTPIPAMVDYPNHLARMYVLSRNGTADANPYYEVTWALIPIWRWTCWSREWRNSSTSKMPHDCFCC